MDSRVRGKDKRMIVIARLRSTRSNPRAGMLPLSIPAPPEIRYLNQPRQLQDYQR
jgi:hypothetical protein